MNLVAIIAQMLRLQEQSGHIFEKVLRTKTGALARVKFLVMEFDGKSWVKVISIEAIDSSFKLQVSSFKKSATLCLPCLKTKAILPEVEKVIAEEIESPFFDLTFFVSQPTRAPADGR